MAISDHVDFNGFMDGVKRRNPYQPEFVQAVQEVAEDIFDFIKDKEQYHEQQILRRISEPDRVISFRVCWEDDNGNKAAKILFAPGTAANAGGVAVSGLEMSQNSERRAWKEEELQPMLKAIMSGIHTTCQQYGDQGDGYIDYVKGANIGGFKKVADAMLAFGVV